MLLGDRRQTLIPDGIDASFVASMNVKSIIKAICNYYNLKRDEMLQCCRKGHIVQARHMTCYFLSINPGISLSCIGQLTGQRSHSSVIHSRDVIENLFLLYPSFERELRLLFEVLRIKQ